jgi:branched-chain amino acid transport system permease protein
LTAETLRLVTIYANGITGGATGLSPIPSLGALSLGPIALSLDDGSDYYVFLLTVVVAVSAALFAVERSRIGFYWKAIRQSETLCASAGVNTTLLKTVNFAIGAAVAGLTGALWAHYEAVLTPSYTSVFGAMSSMLLLAYLYVGGTERFGGPALGVLLLTTVAEAARIEETHVPLVTGVAMIGAVLLLPDGVSGGIARAVARLRRAPRAAAS